MWFVMRVIIDQSGKQSNSIQMYTTEEQALKRYYTVLGADIDKDEYQYELVQVVREDGIVIASQVFRHSTTEV